jgi:dienelactone hydrolase
MQSVRDGRLVGVLCSPEGNGSHPGVLVLGGSEGGLHERDAQVLSDEGFTVLALAYFGVEGLPPGLIDIPLEYFFQALDYLGEHSSVSDRLGVVGGSRGGEAALLVAAHDQRIAATVSVVGSGLVTEGIDFRRGEFLQIIGEPQVNSWTLGGRSVPFLPYQVSQVLKDQVARGQLVDLAGAFPPVPTDPVVLEEVSIPIEQTRGAVLLLSAEDDRSWPSTAYSQVAGDRLANASFCFEHRVFAGAGHQISGPPGKEMTVTTSPGPGVTFELGGTPKINNAARTEAWNATVAFFKSHLRFW